MIDDSSLARSLQTGFLRTGDDGKTYIHFNRITIQQRTPWKLVVEYQYAEPGSKKFMTVQVLEVPINMAQGQTVNLDGIVGKMGIQLTTT